MRCDDARRRLAAERYGELDDEDAVELRMHLASCASCRRDRASIDHAWAHLNESIDLEDPVDVESVLDAVRARPRVDSVPPRRRYAVAVGIAAGLLAGVVVLWCGARIELGGGRLVITLGAVGEEVVAEPSADAPAIDRSLWLAELAAMWERISDDLDARDATQAARAEEALRLMFDACRRDRLELVRHIERLAREQADQSHRMHGALSAVLDLATFDSRP